jgi:hypothetical protein
MNKVAQAIRLIGMLLAAFLEHLHVLNAANYTVAYRDTVNYEASDGSCSCHVASRSSVTVRLTESARIMSKPFCLVVA